MENKALEEAFHKLWGRYQMIVLLRKKIIELGGDPDFYLTDKQREDRKEWEKKCVYNDAGPLKVDKIDAYIPFITEYF